MTSRDTIIGGIRGSWIRILLFAVGLLLLSAVSARAQSVGGCVANFGGVIDGFVNPVPPSQINIDGNCTIQNFPASNPLTSNISFAGTGRGWLVIFNNVDFTGNMSCDKVHGNFIWFVNGSVAGAHVIGCANLFVPVDKIDKQNPPGPPFVSVGVPFTYTLTFPELVSATTGAVVNPNGSNTEVDQVAITDNLNATGVSLSYVSSSATWKSSGAPVGFSATNVGGLLTFNGFPAIPAGQQIVLKVTVVLNNAVPPNSPGTQFSNTANWTLGTTIGGTFHFPIPGQQGVSSPPLTIGAPGLVLTKGGPATMNPGQLGQFTLNAQNAGNTDAWNATIVDKLPAGATGGMCNTTPQVLSAQVFQADGVTPVAGKGPLVRGTDYTFSYVGAPTCTLTLNMQSAAAAISPTQRLIFTYQTQLDANTQNGASLTNVAGTTQWYNGPSTAANRQSYTCALTNGTPGVLDCQDAHTVNVVIPALTITKQVTVVGGGRAAPGATLDYMVHVTNTSTSPVSPVAITDNLNAAGPGALTYVAGTATMNGSPTGVSVAANVITANYSTTYGPLAAGGTIDLHFRATLGNTLANGTIVTNTGTVTWNTPPQTASASVSVTVGGVVGSPNLVFTKSGPATMSLGQSGQFGFNVQNTGTSDAWNVTLLDQLPSGATGGMCTTAPQVLTAQVFQSDGVTPVAGPLKSGTDFSISYAGAPSCKLTLTVLTAAGTIAPTQRLIVTYRAQLDATSQIGAQLTNIAGAVQWFDADKSLATRQTFTHTLTDGTPGTLDFQDAHTVTVVSNTITITKQVTVVGGGRALPGATLDYLVHVTNVSTNPISQAAITDNLNAAGAGALTYVAGTATMNGSANGVSVAANVITANYSTTYGPLAAGGTIDLHFRATLGGALSNGTIVTNTGTVTWNTPPQTASASVSVTVGGVVGTPNLVFTKSGPATMNLGQSGQFGFNVQNTGTSDAWNVTLLDQLPSGATGGMCTTAPQVLTAQVFQSDGVTPANGALVPGTDFSISYAGAPSCKLTLTMLTAAGTIAPTQRLIVTYRAQLDANSQIGAQLTNIAGAVQWFDADKSLATRQTFTHTLTDGTPGTLDFQDAHTVMVANITTLTITKQVSVVGGGAAMPGGQLDYLVHITNASTNPATPVVITDDLSTAGAGRLTFVNPAATMNGSTTGISIVGSLLTANYSAGSGPLQPGQSIDVRFRVQIASGLTAGTTLTNTAVVTWNNPSQTASASVSIDIGGVPGAGSLNGTAWLDANFNKSPDLGEPLLQGWTVGLYLNGALLQSGLTDVNGVYRFSNVSPTDGTSNRYELRFSAPGAGPNTAKLGKADSPFTNSLQRITNIGVPSGSNLQNLNLPIAPNGVVYNSATRSPIAGATLKMLQGGTPLPGACFDDPAQQSQITQAGGYYRFDLNFSDPSCPSGASYLIVVTAPGSSFVAGESQVIPPSSNASTAPFSVVTCPTDALPVVPYCEAQASEFAPAPSVVARSAGTQYYLNLTLGGTAVPGSNQIYNNHIPLDPQLSGAFSITKTTPQVNVTRGQLVPYTITVNNVIGGSLQGQQIVDRYPAGFRYVPGSARLDGVPSEPKLSAGQLVWSGLNFTSSTRTIVLLLAVGAGVGEGEFVNHAQVIDGTGKPLSADATARVRVVPDQTFDCTDVYGKVFNDVNRNGVQDAGENGLPGVRVVTVNGLEAMTDSFGRFHITCAVTPNEDRGSNFVLKLDDRTLPSGFRMSTDQVQIKRATRGKALKFDFGASIHRVVAIDLSDSAFEPGKTEIRVQWRPRIDLLLAELRKSPSVLRLSYVADTEDAALVEQRLQAIKQQLTQVWDAKKDGYVLAIEPEVFWRLGGPPKRLDGRVPGSR